jgi:ABC-type branched-subunit amino acid transport system substrate-binding protein
MSITPFYTADENKTFRSSKKKQLFIIGLLISIIVENSIIYQVEPIETKIIYTHWILLINSSTAAGLSVILVLFKFSKQKIFDYHLKTHIALAAGLVLWLCANIQWLIYELEEIVPDIPSLADFFWLAAYPFLGYSLYFTFKEFYKKYQNKSVVFTSLACGILLVIFIIYITISLSVFSSPQGIVFFSVIITYPILNMVLIIPAIVMVLGFKKEPESSIPRMFESISLINLVIADSWFVIIFLSSLVDAIWYSNLLIVDHYLIMSAGLLWSIIFHSSNADNYRLKIKRWFNHSNKVQRITLLMSISAVILTIFFVYSFNQKTDSYSITTTYSNINNNHTEIKIGALLGLSGSAYESGKIQKAVLDKAVNDINENFSKSNTQNRIVLQIEDTEIKPDVALAKVKKLVDKGIRIIIGPQTSSELKKIKEYADEHNVLIISQSSTAPSLSKNDTIFRLLQNDINQGKQIAEKMWNDGVKVVVPILRNDSYGNELYDITKENFEKLGGIFTSNAVKYNPQVGKFAASLHRINFIIWDQELKAVSLAVSNAKKNFSPNSDSKVGVYVIAYGEFVPILIQAPTHENLDDEIYWYGSEATAKNERLLKHHKAVEFAHKTHFLSPMFALDDTNKKLLSLVNAIGFELNSNDVNVYDALWIAALTENISGDMTFGKLKENFNKIIKSYQGASGIIKLDNSGDRIGNYDFWTVKENIHDNHYEWEKVTEKESK